MKIPDMEKFRQAVEEEQADGRILESMQNNKRFPGFYLRYVNTNTLCYRLNEGRNFKAPGIGIDILPLRGLMSSRMGHLWNRALEVGWQQTCDKYNDKPGLKKIVCGIPVKLLSMGGRAHLGKSLYEKFCKKQAVAGTKEYVVRMGRNGSQYYPAEIFNKTSHVTLEGETFLAPDEKIWYLQKTYGPDYMEEQAEEYKPNPAVMTSALVGYEEFFAEAGSQKKFIKARRRQYVKDSVGRRRQRYYNWCWSYAKLCAVERNVGEFYLKNKDYIKNLYENGDFMRLESIFRPYTKIMQRCLKEKELYVPDEEILEIYLAVMGETGNQELKTKAEQYWR